MVAAVPVAVAALDGLVRGGRYNTTQPQRTTLSPFEEVLRVEEATAGNPPATGALRQLAVHVQAVGRTGAWV